MRLLKGTTRGPIATVLVLAMTLLSLFGVSLLAAPGAGPSAAPTVRSAGPALHVAATGAHPAQAPTVTVSFTTTLPLYSNLPENLAWSVAVTGQTVAPNNTMVFLQINSEPSGSSVNNISLADELAAGNTTNFNVTLDTTAIPATDGGQFQFIAWVNVNNTAGSTAGQASQTGYIVINQPTAAVLSPSPSFGVGPGNQTVVVQYSGDFVTGVQVNISLGTTLVYTQSVFSPGKGAHVVAAVAPWTVTASGQYVVTVTVTRTYFGGSSWSWNVSAVVPTTSQGYIYINTTKWVNTTTTTSSNGGKIDGLDVGVLAAVLLVAGLIVGMIVALLLGRMMWGGGAKPAPAQAWSGKAGTNECSICHQTFATEDELKEHSKTAHGM